MRALAYGTSSSVPATYRITKATSLDLSSGTISVKGAVAGFSCTSTMGGSIARGEGHITSEAECYVLRNRSEIESIAAKYC